ncbi:MAG: hypothetical protein AB7F86_17680 [Bdellovibrionales bacterium]
MKRIIGLNFLILFSVGCGQKFHSSAQRETLSLNDSQTPIDLDNPSYSKTIAPLFQKHCNSCHQEGGVAPFVLTDFPSVKRLQTSIVRSLTARTMPPPGVDNSGKCQDFSNATWLRDEEINAVVKWYQSGLPIGENAHDLLPPQPKQLVAPVTRLTMAERYTPSPSAGELDDYRCFLLDPGQSADTFITAIQVSPDRATQVHHVIIFKPTSEEAQQNAEAKLGEGGRPGYSCFGAAGVAADVVGLWAPGGNAQEMQDPETGKTIGLRLEKGRKLIMQVHYNTQNTQLPDQSSIVVKTQDEALETKWIVMANFMLSLKPGLSEVIESDTQGNSWWQTVDQIFSRGLADEYIAGGGLLDVLSWDLVKLVLNQPSAKNFKVYGVAPHMHIMGRQITLEKVATDKTNTCLADVPKFDFNWQAGYNYVRPLTITKTDKLKITCRFNTSDRTEKVYFGEGTEDEMCLAFLLVAAQPD